MAVRFTADVLNGVPSIVMGISIYSLVVMQQHHFSAFAGGVALAVMMVPMLFTALGNQFWSYKLTEPIAALPLQIYVYAISPYDEWHRLAWAGSLVLIVMIMVAVTLVRIYASRGVLKGAS
jgi:ABC-type phosphate transport system permease subunit